MISEAYEAVDAIEARDAVVMKGRAKDVLLQVVAESTAVDAGEFTIDDVAPRYQRENGAPPSKDIFCEVHILTPEEVTDISGCREMRER